MQIFSRSWLRSLLFKQMLRNEFVMIDLSYWFWKGEFNVKVKGDRKIKFELRSDYDPLLLTSRVTTIREVAGWLNSDLEFKIIWASELWIARPSVTWRSRHFLNTFFKSLFRFETKSCWITNIVRMIKLEMFCERILGITVVDVR